MPTNKNIDEILEYVFKRTQNLNEAWINDSIGFDMIPTVETRSTMVGDLFVVCFKSKTGRGFIERTYQIANRGFKRVA
jgi:hypothetical protein